MKKVLLIIAILVILTACTINQPVNNSSTNNQPANNTEQPKQECSSDSDCMKSGCSGQLCIPKSQKGDGFTICDFKPEYECYSTQNCICVNNKCSWSNQEELSTCIKSKAE